MYHHKDAVHVRQAYQANEVLPPYEVEALGKIMSASREIDASNTASAADELRGIIQVFKSPDSNVLRPTFIRIEQPNGSVSCHRN